MTINNHSTVHGRRRFTCLAPGLVRMEFAPDGCFEDRRSLVACAPKAPIPFTASDDDGGSLRLETGRMTVISRAADQPFFPANLEVRWRGNGLLQLWRPGDVDYLNLGGTVRSLDGFNRDAPLTGVHPADMQSPDARALMWHAWNMCEVDPWYLEQTGKKGGIYDLHQTVRHRPEHLLARTANHVRDQYRYAPGILSRSGYFFLNDSDSAVLDEDDFPVERARPGAQDWYFFAYDGDFAQALRDWRLLSGPAPLPPPQVFGLIFSRWPAYGEAEAKAIIARFVQEGMPLSALVLDMEWHLKGWCRWDWNPDMYPHPEAFFRWCHERGLLVTLNVHPLNVRKDDSHFEAFVEAAGASHMIAVRKDGDDVFEKVDINIGDKRLARAFMRTCHDAIVDQGLDFWWVDGTQGVINGSCDQLVTNKLYFENVRREGKRGMLLSRYGGLGSHRYGVCFTGDTYSQWETLRAQCEFNIRAGHVGLAYVSHDVGGFSHPEAPLIDPILYLRWLQFGVFNPVLRFHSCPGAGSRQPWDYGRGNLAIAKRWLEFRNSLLPYLYTAARRHHDTGWPIVRGLFLEYPHDPAAYRFDQFLFGDALLAAPVLAADNHRRVYLPEGDWFPFEGGEVVRGPREIEVIAGLDEVPLYARAGSVVVCCAQNATPGLGCWPGLRLDVFPGPQGSATLYEDDGRTNPPPTAAASLTRFNLHVKEKRIELDCQPAAIPVLERRSFEIDLRLAQAPGGASLDGQPLDHALIQFHPSRQRCLISLRDLPADQAWTLVIFV